jgi:hypothetical protein
MSTECYPQIYWSEDNGLPYHEFESITGKHKGQFEKIKGDTYECPFCGIQIQQSVELIRSIVNKDPSERTEWANSSTASCIRMTCYLSPSLACKKSFETISLVFYRHVIILL